MQKKQLNVEKGMKMHNTLKKKEKILKRQKKINKGG